MSSTKTKTFSCKYCDISYIPRNEYKKHIRTNKHKNMLEYSRQCDKVRTLMTVNQKSSSTQLKFTKDGKYVNDYIKNMMETEEKKFNCKYCDIDGLLRKEFIKHTKTKDHKETVEDVIHGEEMRQTVKCAKLGGWTGIGIDKAILKELKVATDVEDKFNEKIKRNKKNKKKKK